jgi:hypothetical protein
LKNPMSGMKKQSRMMKKSGMKKQNRIDIYSAIQPLNFYIVSFAAILNSKTNV